MILDVGMDLEFCKDEASWQRIVFKLHSLAYVSD